MAAVPATVRRLGPVSFSAQSGNQIASVSCSTAGLRHDNSKNHSRTLNKMIAVTKTRNVPATTAFQQVVEFKHAIEAPRPFRSGDGGGIAENFSPRSKAISSAGNLSRNTPACAKNPCARRECQIFSIPAVNVTPTSHISGTSVMSASTSFRFGGTRSASS